MADYSEDVIEEKEFRSLNTFEQQRYLKKIQEIDKCFKDLEKDLNNRAFIDIEEVEDYEENFDHELSNWTDKIALWESRHPDKKSLSNRMYKELESYMNKYKKIQASIVDNLDDDKTIVQRKGDGDMNTENKKIQEKGESIKYPVEKRNAENEVNLDEIVTKLEHRIEDINEKLEVMYKAKDTLKRENASVKEQNKHFQDENNELVVKIQNLQSFIESILACDDCGIGFKDKTSLKNHILSSHVEKEYECDTCTKRFRTIDALQNHEKSKHGQKYEMKILVKKHDELVLTLNRQKTKLHESIYQLKQTEVITKARCSCRGICFINHSKYRWTKSKADLFFDDLKMQDSSIQHQCNQCDNKFEEKEDLHCHIEIVHLTESNPSDTDKCKTCDSNFDIAEGLNHHNYTHHGISNGSPCTQCDKTFNHQNHLNMHIETRQKGRSYFKCQPCNQTFSEEVILIDHMKTTH